MNLVLIAPGGAIGASARYLLGGVVHEFTPPDFPYGTFVVNVIGCAMFGMVVGLEDQRFVVGPATRTFILIGVIGGFTTFSSYTFETFALLRDGQVLRAVINSAGQVILGLLALWASYVGTRLLFVRLLD